MFKIFAVLELLGAAAAIGVVIHNHRRARAAFPPVSDDAIAVSGWHWSEPPDGLEVRQRAGASAVSLPLRPNPTGQALALLGYATLLFALFVLVNGLRVYESLWIPTVGSAIFALFGWGLMHGDARLSCVVLSEDRALLVLRYGLRLQRQIALKRRPSLKVTGGYISSFEMNARHKEPEYRLRAGRHKVLSDCNQTQGSWLVNGLLQWARGASDARS